MKFPATINRFSEANLEGRSLHLAIGMFDGVHLGHHAVIESAVRSARVKSAVSAVLTFWPHPSKILNKDNYTRLIMCNEIKSQIIFKMGIDLIILKKFDQKFATINSSEFIPFLKKSLPTLKSIYVGENFRYGKGRIGNIGNLISEAANYDISAISLERIKFNGEPISSTRIRNEILNGNMELVNSLLGYTYYCKGSIISGKGLGKTIGFSTINLDWTPELKPKYGVYAVTVGIKDGSINIGGVANYGLRPTVNDETQPLLEIHLFKDMKLNNGDSVFVEFHNFLRPEKKFSSIDELKEQIILDKERAKKLLK